MASTAAETTVEHLLERIREPLLEIEREYRSRGRSVTELGLEKLARQITAVVPVPSPVNEQIGPFYRTDQVVRLLDITRQAVHDRVRKGGLLAAQTVEGTWVYPTFQFDGRHLIDGLKAVLREFDLSEADRWAIAAWWVSPDAALNGQSPLEWIRKGKDQNRVRSLARNADRRWKQ